MPAPVIDCHVHLYPAEVGRDPAGWAAKRGEPGWAALCLRRRRDGRPVQDFPDLGGLLRSLDEAGIERAVLLGWYWEQASTCEEWNRFAGACIRAHPDRLAAFAALQPGAGAAEAEAQARSARDEGLAGLGELCPPAQGCRYDSPGMAAALELAEAWGWPVNLHVTDPESRPYPGRIETPLEEIDRLARDRPGNRFILSHWGGLLPLRRPEAAARSNLWYDTSASPLLYGAEIWGRFLAAVPAERVLFGSDYPLRLYPRHGEDSGLGRFLQEVRGSLDSAAQETVLGGNALRLLRF